MTVLDNMNVCLVLYFLPIKWKIELSLAACDLLQK